MTTVGDDHGLGGPAGAGPHLLDGPHDVQALHDLTEHHVLAVEPLGLGGTDEELRSVGAGASIGHGENSGAGVLLDEVLIGELGAIDGFAACAVPGCEVTALAHEPRDHTVEG